MKKRLKWISNAFLNLIDKNILLCIITVIIFFISFFSKNGILHLFLIYNFEKINNKVTIKILNNKIELLNKQIILLNNKNIEVLEEINYEYKNITPYYNKDVEIININDYKNIK